MHELDPTTTARERPAEDANGDLVAPMRWFTRAFGIALVAHLVGNPAGWRTTDGSLLTPLVGVSAILGLLAVSLVARPGRLRLSAAAVLVLASVWLEAPRVGNHWLLMGIVSAAVLLSHARRDPWPWLSLTGRWILLCFYSFAAFAKLNTGFLDPAASCGVFYANQSLASFGLPTFASSSPAAWVSIAGPVLVELSVPVLLLLGRTRRAGVLLAFVFHTVISLDFDQNFYDFTSVLMLLLCLFLPEETLSDWERRASSPARLRTLGLALCTVTVAASLMPPVLASVVAVRLLGFATWVPFAAWMIVRAARAGLGRFDVPMRVRGLATGLLAALVVANGLTPYLEVKTGTSFNMYANLVTVGGETNHLVVRRTLHLSDVQDDLVEVVSSEDEGLRRYAEDRYLLPERNLLDYLARHPDVEAVVRTPDGTERTVTGADGVRQPVVVTKFLAFRAVDQDSPPRCQALWLPAR